MGNAGPVSRIAWYSAAMLSGNPAFLGFMLFFEARRCQDEIEFSWEAYLSGPIHRLCKSEAFGRDSFFLKG